MAGSESSEKPAFSLTILVDKKKEKVVLAEVSEDFVNVLFSFLGLPMGTIVRLLEKFRRNQKSQGVIIGCFNNLYKSVMNLDTASFKTEACQQILLYPRSVKEKQCRKLKVNIDDTEVMKYYKCPNFGNAERCSTTYSNFFSFRCFCGELMMEEFEVSEDGCAEILTSQKTSFIVTDNMEVVFASIATTLETLRGHGYTDLVKLEEMVVHVNHNEVLALLHSSFSSETPFTDVFLKKQSSCGMTSLPYMPSLAVQESNDVVSLTVFFRRQDMKILYAESDHEFVDQLLIFLVLRLETVWELSGSNTELGCIGNLYKSMRKNYRYGVGTNNKDILLFTSVLPWLYRSQKSLLDVCHKNLLSEESMTKHFKGYQLEPMHPNYDRSLKSRLYGSTGLMRQERTYMISDDLTITSTNSSSTISIMKIWNLDLDDIEEHVINISKTEAINLLSASLTTSTALTSALGSLLPKMPKEENL